MSTQPELITTAERLADAAAAWARAPWLALDTEFLREDTYHPQLCLVQVNDGHSNACIDALALPEPTLHPLWALLGAAGPRKVLHAASQDLEIFVRHSGAAVTPLFDTQIAAALLGYGDQLGYAALIERLLGVQLDKSLTRTDWSRRPLRPAEIEYAAADVHYLAEIHGTLTEQLHSRGRLHWAEEDCARLADPTRYQNPPDDAWSRLKGLNRLPPAAQRVAVGLAIWRETVAQERNRPRKWILDDDALYRLSERRPQHFDELKALQVLAPKTLERHGAAILAAIEKAAERVMPAAALETPLDDAQKQRLKRLQDALKKIAEAAEVSASLIAPRAELEALTRYGAEAEVVVLTGWRRELAGAALLNVL